MAIQSYRKTMLWGLICVLTLVPLCAAAQEEMGFPLLLSTGMPTAATPEEILPVGAIAYVRANNVQMLLENVDSLLTTFVPEKALPRARKSCPAYGQVAHAVVRVRKSTASPPAASRLALTWSAPS